MVCNIIDECRCFSYSDTTAQFCGARRGPNVVACPSDCCAGGCQGEPFRIIERPVIDTNSDLTIRIIIFIILLAISYLILT